jgi:hypothetical protein
MRKVEDIEKQIRELSREDFAELREWFYEQDWGAWDAKLDADVRGGKLDRLAETARRAHAAGKTTKL